MPREAARSAKAYEAKEPKPLTRPSEAKRDTDDALRAAEEASGSTDNVAKFMALRERQRHTEEQMKKLDKLKTKSSDAQREKLEEVHKRLGAEMKELGDFKELSADADFRETHPLKDWKFRKDEWQPNAAAEMRKILDEDPEAAKAMKAASKRKQEAPEEFEIADGDILESKDDTREAEKQFFGEALESGRMPLASSKGEESWSSRERALYEPLKAKYDSLARYANKNDKQFEQVKSEFGFTWEDIMNAPEDAPKKKLKRGEKAQPTKLELIKKLEGVHRELVHFPMKKAASHTEISAEEAMEVDKRFSRAKSEEKRGSLSTSRRELTPSKADETADRTKLGPEYAKRIAEAKEKTVRHRKELEGKKATGGRVTRLLEAKTGEPSAADTDNEDELRRKYAKVGGKELGFIWKEYQTAKPKEQAKLREKINEFYREQAKELPPATVSPVPEADEDSEDYEILSSESEKTQVIPGREVRGERSLRGKYDALVRTGDWKILNEALGFTWAEYEAAPMSKAPPRKGLFAGLARFLRGKTDLPAKPEMTKRINDAYAKMMDEKKSK